MFLLSSGWLFVFLHPICFALCKLPSNHMKCPVPLNHINNMKECQTRTLGVMSCPKTNHSCVAIVRDDILLGGSCVRNNDNYALKYDKTYKTHKYETEHFYWTSPCLNKTAKEHAVEYRSESGLDVKVCCMNCMKNCPSKWGRDDRWGVGIASGICIAIFAFLPTVSRFQRMYQKYHVQQVVVP